MASEITKVSVVDSRILQQKPKFAVEKGPLSLTNVPYRSITATQSQMTFNIIVPSESVFIDRAVDWQSTVYAYVDVTLTGTATAGLPICVYGRDVALAPFPLHEMCATMSATINDTTTVVNTNDVKNTLLRLTDYKKHRKLRTCPNMLDRYQVYPAVPLDTKASSAPTAMNSPLNAFGDEHNVDEKPNGSWGDFQWTLADGTVPTTSGNTAVGATGGNQTAYNLATTTSGASQPIFSSGNVATTSVYRLYFRFKSTERLLISPFVFADNDEVSTGLFGIQNIQLLMNFQSPAGAGRLLRATTGNLFCSTAQDAGISAFSATQFNNAGNGGSPFMNPLVNVQYLTPSLDVPLPAKNIVPYIDSPRYISQQNVGTVAPTLFHNNVSALPVGQPVNSQTITLPAIPDLLAIFVKPNQYVTSVGGSTPDPSQGDWVLPITGISINFDNYAGLLSAHSQEQLYRMSVRNGLEMDFDQWRGYAGGASVTGLPVALSGGPLLLKPGRDIVLQAGQAPSLVGNFSLQFTLYVQNQTGVTQSACQIYVVALNSGYLETIKGSSRIIKGVLTEQDILSAPMGPGSSDAHMERRVGAGNIEDKANEMDGSGRRRHRSSRMSSYR
jgi:hypothetical protein